MTDRIWTDAEVRALCRDTCRFFLVACAALLVLGFLAGWVLT